MILIGDALSVVKTLPDQSVNCIVTSPPYYGLRDYGVEGQMGIEPTLNEYIERMALLFDELRRVLRDDGTLWLNIGDSYSSSGKCEVQHGKQATNKGTFKPGRDHRVNGFKEKELMGVPWRFAFALQDSGWFLRRDIIWHKPNAMPESVKDRPTTAHEYIFLLSKSKRYWYDADAIRTPATPSTKIPQGWDTDKGSHGDYHKNGRRASVTASKAFGGPNGGMRKKHQPGNGQPSEKPVEGLCERQVGANARSVWSIAVSGFHDEHFATFPVELPKRCILAGCPVGGVVLDPFAGSGTTLMVAKQLGRQYLGIELNPEYAKLIEERLSSVTASLFMG